MHKNVWYNVGVPKHTEKKNENFSLKMPISIMARLKEIAEFEDRPLGYIGRELMVRGLALYEMDGKIRGEAATETMRRLAPVVARIDRPEMTKQEIRRSLEEQPRRTTKIPVGGKAR
jgi:hypothetical protein